MRFSRFNAGNTLTDSEILEIIEEGELQDWLQLYGRVVQDKAMAQRVLPAVRSQTHSPYAGQCFGAWVTYLEKVLEPSAA